MVTYEDGFTGEMCKRAEPFSLTPPPTTLGHMLGAPDSGLCLPCRPCSPSPSPHTSPEKCEVISPRQRLRSPLRCLLRALQAAEGWRWDLGRLFGARAQSPLCAALCSTATHGAEPQAGHDLHGQPESSPREMLHPCLSPSPVECRVAVILS